MKQRDFKATFGRMHGNRQNAGWLSEVQDENAAGEAQQEFLITVEKVQRACKNMSPWKATGLDGVQGYWIKGFTTLHGRVAHQLNDIVQSKKVSSWLNKGRTVLIPKDSAEGNTPSNFRPITCLPLMWKLLTSMISNKIYEHMAEKNKPATLGTKRAHKRRKRNKRTTSN